MSASAAPAPPANTVATTTSVTTPVATVGATANLPSWLSGTWVVFYAFLLMLYIIAYWFGAAKIAYDQTGSGLWAFAAFLFAPFYYPYFAFFVSKPAPVPMMGGKRGIVSTIRSVTSGVDKVAQAVLKSLPR